jgi:hypothetical protein
MNIGDRVKTPFGEYGLIIRKAEPPNDWVIENAEDDDVYESYPETSLVLIPRPENTAADRATAEQVKKDLFRSAAKAILDLMSEGDIVTITKPKKKRSRNASERNTLQG